MGILGRSPITWASVGIVIALSLAIFSYEYFPSSPAPTTQSSGVPQHAEATLLGGSVVNRSIGAFLDLNVTIKNSGMVPIWYYQGGGSSLSVVSWSPKSTFEVISPSSPACSLPSYQVVIQPGAIANAHLLGCQNPQYYRIARVGAVNITYSFEWMIVNGSGIVYLTNQTGIFFVG